MEGTAWATSEIVSSWDRSPHSAANSTTKLAPTARMPVTSRALAANSSPEATWWLHHDRRDGARYTSLFHAGGSEVLDCEGLRGRALPRRDRVVVTVPRVCIDRPAWIRFGASMGKETKTHHLIDADALRAMKPTAVLVNTSRGPVVDPAALERALTGGEIFAAGLDVVMDRCPKIEYPRVFATRSPHDPRHRGPAGQRGQGLLHRRLRPRRAVAAAMERAAAQVE